ncbi:hypothetical protein FGB62_58g036 [Gracilaria domingensis]|nr:hypothetical protein FGB62_58g036 [Gracilaria domingensis]
MFDNDSSSSSSTERTKTPFNAVKEAANAISRRKRPTNPDLEKEIEHIFSQPVQREDARKKPRKSRYVGKLVESAKRRKADAQRVLERRIIKEREKEQELYGETERFVTPAYKKRLEENDRLTQMELREQNEQPSAQDVSGFYTRLLQARVNNEKENEKSDPTPEAEPTEHPGLELSKQNATDDKHISNATSQSYHPDSKTTLTHDNNKSYTNRREVNPVAQITTSSEQTLPAGKKTEQVVRKKRGLRRNTPQSIEAYRQRYFERRARRLAADKT